MPPFNPIWEYDPFGNIIGGVLDATPVSTLQTRFDCPLDSYLQMLVFRAADTHALRAIMVKFTGHPVMRDYPGDIGNRVMDSFQTRFGADIEVMYCCGYGGNHRFLAAQAYPSSLNLGSNRTVKAFGDVLEQTLPSLTFTPLSKVGVVTGYDTFGRTGASAAGTDPDRLGIGVQAFALNDNYLSILPSEAPSEQGLYVRARTCDLKHFYNGYGNAQLIYYGWGRFGGSDAPNVQETFRMAQELVRSVNILEQSVETLHYPGDINGDNHVNVGDLQALVAAWASRSNPYTTNWNASADLNGDGRVDIGDLLVLVANWGKY
jgi:hypothetical protein